MGGPYLPPTAGLGGRPNKSVDVPITSVFLVLFICGAVTHMTIFQMNKRRGHKFILNGLMFGFCMARTVACTMRLVWATHLHNVRIAIAAQIFVAAAVVLLWIVNLIFAQRIVRAQHSYFAWQKWFGLVIKLLIVTIILGIAAVITCVIQSFYTLDKNILRIDLDVQHVVTTYFAFIAFLPLPLLALRLVLPRKVPTEKFGEGRMKTKIALLIFTSTILTLGAAFRSGIGYVPRPASNPAWYHSKACFYLFNFTIEITVVFLYAVFRVDKRFHVPNGSKAPGDYSKGAGLVGKTSLDERITDEEHAIPREKMDGANQVRGS
ncbi:hypothetical protein PVAG01_00926 [Phlyctema vagabunda]|uniref:Uncharacterized protein n=1 Tax=Phlyctema vagabunda TaxID=108571 RepID=A0ABR4PW65_9HELO